LYYSHDKVLVFLKKLTKPYEKNYLPPLFISFIPKINAQRILSNNESIQNKTIIILPLNAKIFVTPTQIIEKELY
jgi:hypothetical protein